MAARLAAPPLLPLQLLPSTTVHLTMAWPGWSRYSNTRSDTTRTCVDARVSEQVSERYGIDIEVGSLAAGRRSALVDHSHEPNDPAAAHELFTASISVMRQITSHTSHHNTHTHTHTQ